MIDCLLHLIVSLIIIFYLTGCDSWSCLNSVEAYNNGAWKLVAPLQTGRRGCGVSLKWLVFLNVLICFNNFYTLGGSI